MVVLGGWKLLMSEVPLLLLKRHSTALCAPRVILVPCGTSNPQNGCLNSVDFEGEATPPFQVETVVCVGVSHTRSGMSNILSGVSHSRPDSFHTLGCFQHSIGCV